MCDAGWALLQPLITSQKACPEAVKEHVCTLVWASGRMAVKELVTVRNQFFTKYDQLLSKENSHVAITYVNKDIKRRLESMVPPNRDIRELLLAIAEESQTQQHIPKIFELLPDEPTNSALEESGKAGEVPDEVDEFLRDMSMEEGDEDESDSLEYDDSEQNGIRHKATNDASGSSDAPHCAYAPKEGERGHRKHNDPAGGGKEGASSSAYDTLASRLAKLKGKT
eukprot:gb/GECG01008804.1/.p1 GENE.gb/GECG01008804.1/~~gb/GECG01008804.1/.p1  ORF type:complete len:225 (+),score=44.53 gb/GECG01008804.1/:1-675(+)